MKGVKSVTLLTQRRWTQQRWIPWTLVLLLIPAAHATTIISGDLYFTTYGNQGGGGGTNVWKIPFVYDTVYGLCVGQTAPLTQACPTTDPVPTAIAALSGADGLSFDPNDPTNTTLLVGEQSANKIAKISKVNTASPVIVEKASDVSQTDPQAYGVTPTPDKAWLLSVPNGPWTAGDTYVNVSRLNPSFGDGSTHATNPATPIRGIAYIGSTAYFGNAKDGDCSGAEGGGYFGTIDLSNIGTPNSVFGTKLVGVHDAASPTLMCSPVAQGKLPSHSLTYDSFSGCLIMSVKNQIWQLCPSTQNPGDFDVVAKVEIPDVSSPPAPYYCTHSANNPDCNFVNWDQTTVDGQGHLFAANDDGDLLFIDYSKSATKRITDPKNYSKYQFLAITLDDIVFTAAPPPSSLPGRMTGGGSVFESDGTRVTHGFELHCDTADVPNSLEINWAGHRFHLETLVSAFCFKDPGINAGHPTNIFNTYVGTGSGRFDGAPGATANWIFTDAGEPGRNDMATITIKDSFGNVVLTVSGKLDSGNQQAHVDNK